MQPDHSAITNETGLTTALELSPSPESLRTHLQTLQSRITTHGNRVWQLPFTYLAAASVAVSLTLRENVKEEIASTLCYGLALIGLVVLFAILDAYLSYRRTAKVMNRIEARLGFVPPCTSASVRHAIPHFLICAGTIVLMLICATAFGQQS